MRTSNTATIEEGTQVWITGGSYGKMNAPLEAIFGHACGTDSWCVYVPSMRCTKTLRTGSFSMVDPRTRARNPPAPPSARHRNYRRPPNQQRHQLAPQETVAAAAPRADSPLLREDRPRRRGPRDPMPVAAAAAVRTRLRTLRSNAVTMQQEIEALSDLLDDTYLDV